MNWAREEEEVEKNTHRIHESHYWPLHPTIVIIVIEI